MVWEGSIGLSPDYHRTYYSILMHEFHTTCKVKFNYVYFHVGNLAHTTLGHVMAVQPMWLNIQCQLQSKHLI